MPRSTTVVRVSTAVTVTVTAIAMLAGCSTPAPTPGGSSAPDAASATPTVDPRDQLTERLLTASDFPLANYRVEQDFVIPSPPITTPPPTVSQGTAEPTAAPETLCTGDVSKLPELSEAQGVGRVFSSSGRIAEVILVDESGDLATSLQNQIEECVAQGPVTPPGYDVEYSWRTDGVPQAGGTYTAQYTSVEPNPTNDITMISVGHVGEATLVVFAATKQLRINISLEDYDTIAASAFAKLSS